MIKVKLLILLFAFGVICNVQGGNLPGSGDVIHGPFSSEQSSGDVIHGPFSNKQKSKIKPLQAETDFYQIEPIKWSLQFNKNKAEYKSNANRLWYSFFTADDAPASKPLFVFLNGGPGCATSLNLFAMNTAPYTLDRNRIERAGADMKYYKENKYSWTKLGNLLYIDAPNAGFSYMLTDIDVNGKSHWARLQILEEFLDGDNYNSFIDAAQVLRVVLRFLKEHPAIQKNEVIFVGESYSGVRVTTILNMLLNYDDYGEGSKVYKDQELSTLIKEQIDSLPIENKEHYSYNDIAQQFGRQILIQPQIVDTYQVRDFNEAMIPDDSLLQKLADKANAKTSWKDFKENFKKMNMKGGIGVAITMYMNSVLNRDKYHYQKPWAWSDLNEAFSMKALTNIKDLSKITGCNVNNIKYFSANERKQALRYMLLKDTKIFENSLVAKFIDTLDAEKKLMIKLVPKREIRPEPDNDPDSLNSFFGELNKYDSYISGTNVYVFIGFMAKHGWIKNGNIWDKDTYRISPGSTKRYGKMFLENLSVIDTFMTDAKCDLVVYSPALPKQFDPSIDGRFADVVADVEVDRGNANKDGSFTIDFKPNFLKGNNTSNSRKIHWPHYETSGHSVSSTQPKKFRDDVEKWLQEATH